MSDLMIGKKFSKLTVLKIINNIFFLCKCDCGNEKEVRKADVLRGKTRSCGCIRKDNTKVINQSHGASGTLTYRRWKSMKYRCNNPKNKANKNYAGKGITVCDRWINSYTNFLSDMGECPNKTFTLERKNNNENYNPENCLWASRVVQGRNTSRNRILKFNGQSHCVSEWAEKLGIPAYIIHKRLKRGLNIEQVLIEGLS